MKIAVNTRFLLKDQLEGIGIYTQEIFRRVVQLMPEHEFYFLFDRQPSPEFIFSGNVTPLVVAPQARHPFLWYWWFEKSVPKVLEEHSIDIFISPDGYCSLNTTVPQIITVHDIAFEHYKDHTPFLVRQYYTRFVPKFCAKAESILAVSGFTRQDLISTYKTDERKIKVVYNGFDSSVLPAAGRTGITDKPYFIFIGAVHPRKNVLGLLKAFERFKSVHAHPHQLVIIGRKAWMNRELEDFYRSMKWKQEVIWLEQMKRGDLLSCLQQAFALVYPSFFEGFGIPVLEAMSLGVPVITSDVSSMPEVAGDAALLVSPGRPETIAQAMDTLINNPELRRQCIEKGKERATHFSWDASARQVADILLASGQQKSR